jgi:hypothetical protein
VPSTARDVPRVAVPPSAGPAAPAPGRRRTPVTVVASAVIAVGESLGLLTLGLTRLDRVFGTAVQPSGGLIALTLTLLAGWVVLCAGGGASLVDGAGRTLVVSLACGEIGLLLVLVVGGLLGVPLGAAGPLGAPPAPALALLALVVPVGKLLLARSPSAVAWVAAGPRPRVRRPAAAPGHPVLRAVTLAIIGLALTAAALVGSPATAPTTAAVDTVP